MQRGAAPPQRPRPAVRAENAALAGRQGNQNGAAEGIFISFMSTNSSTL